MKKKIFIIISIILILAIIIFFVYNNKQKENQNDTTNENTIQNNQQENINKNETNVQTTTSNSTENINNNTINITTQNTDSNEKSLVEQVSPIGFMGSSTYKVSLYSNGEVYVEKYDGNGYNQINIISKDLVAKNIDSIEVITDEEQETYGEVIIKSTTNKGELLNNDFGWIEMQK